MATTYRELLSATKKQIREVTIDDVKRSIDGKSPQRLADAMERLRALPQHLERARSGVLHR